MVEFDGVGNEIRGLRPAVIVSNNVGNIYSNNVIVIPITSHIEKKELPTHVYLPHDDTGLKVDSIALCENVHDVSKSRVKNYICTLSYIYMKSIAIASTLATSLISYLSEEDLLKLHKGTIDMNKEEN